MFKRMLGLGLAITLMGCTSVQVHSDYDEEVDFRSYRTFDWMPSPESYERNPAISAVADNLIRQTIERELIADGLQKSLDGRPDLYVVYHAAVEREVTSAEIDAWGYRHRIGGGRAATGTIETHPVGTLVVDLVDAQRRALVWEGVATGAVQSASRIEKKIFVAVQQMFEAYPPI